jgi:Ca-activated chloride channel homolog
MVPSSVAGVAKIGGSTVSAPIDFARPELFWLLALLPLMWARYRTQPWAAIAGRSVVFLLIVAALADPRMVERRPAGQAERVFAFDVSRSMPAETRQWIARQHRLPSSGDRVFVFAGALQETADWKRRLEAPGRELKPERTNLEALFSELLRQPRRERRVFLFTDGWENDGSAERLLPALAEAGIRIYPILPSDRPALSNVAVTKVIAPGKIVKGEALNLKIALENQSRREIDGSVTVKRSGKTVKTAAVKLQPGSQLLNYQLPMGEEPLQSFEAEFLPQPRDADILPFDNRATAWVALQSRDKALVINGRTGEGRYLDELLRRRGYELTSVPAGGAPPAPGEFGIVVLNNVDKDRLTPAYWSAVERHAASGAGVVVLGDSSALTPAYRQTALAPALPVEFSEPKEKAQEPEKTRAVLLVVDKSKSMDPEANQPHENRILYAKEVAKRVISQLADNDLIGVIGFDTAPFPVVQMDTVRNLRSTFAHDIDRLVPKGNTDIIPALREAMVELQRQPADTKYAILITDADFRERPIGYVDLVTRMRNDAKIVVSAVGIGRGVDEALVNRIGSYGGGKTHIARNMNDFPRFEFEPGPKQRGTPSKPQAQEFTPVAMPTSEILAPLAAQTFPRVQGYAESELKRDARLDLMVQNEGRSHPLLASWAYGKGRVVVLTIDQSGRWSRDWVGWRGMERFWGRIFEWLKPEREALPAHEARINRSGDQIVVDFYLYVAEFDGDSFRYTYTGPDGAKGADTLKRVAPGHYRGSLPLARAGNYRIDVKEDRRGRTVSYPPLGYTQPEDLRDEVPARDFNLALLERIARATGGTVDPTNEPVTYDEAHPTTKPLHPYLIFAAAVLFIGEIFARRLLQSPA